MFKGNADKPVKYEQVNGLLDKGCSFEGKLTFDGTVQINGTFQGEVYSDGILVVGNDAHLQASVFVDTLIVYGSVQGTIEAKSRIEMHVPAVVVADIKTKTLSVEDGVVFQGKCSMDRPDASMSREKAAHASKDAGEDADDNVFVM